MESDAGGGPPADGDALCLAGPWTELLSALELMLRQHHDRLADLLRSPLNPVVAHCSSKSAHSSPRSRRMEAERSTLVGKAASWKQHGNAEGPRRGSGTNHSCGVTATSSYPFSKSSHHAKGFEDSKEVGRYAGWESGPSLDDATGEDMERASNGSVRASKATTFTTFSQAEAVRRVSSLAARLSQRGSRRSQSDADRLQQLQYLQAKADEVVKSYWFEMLMSLLILCNTLFCGVETEYMAQMRCQEVPPEFAWISFSFTLIFLVELMLRLTAQGRNFVRKPNSGWNLFDTLVVLISVIDVALAGQEHNNSQMASVRVVRMARVVRVLRIARIMRHFRSLRILICSVLNTLRSLFWTMLLLTMLLYSFGILFTQAATQHLLIPDSPHITRLEDSYGSVGRSIFTLFKAISNGVSWEEIVYPLSSLHPVWVAFFLLYFSFTYFAVLNVVTGVFCNTAIESASQDRDMAAQAQMSSEKHYTRQLQSIFEQINVTRDGIITLQQFEDCLKDEKLRAYFGSIGLSVNEAFSLFKLLDHGNTHVLDVETFVTGCLKLRGQATSMEIAMAMYETRWSLKRCISAITCLDAKFDHLQDYIFRDEAAIVEDGPGVDFVESHVEEDDKMSF